MRFVMRWILRPLLVSILAVIVVLPGCSITQTYQSPLAEVVGELEFAERDIYTIDACVGEIGGRPYLFLMTMAQEAVMKATIHILDVDNPTQPVALTSLDTPIEITTPLGGLALSGTELYVALTGAGEAALWVLGVSDPESPREIALTDTTYAVWRPSISGNYLAVATALARSFAFFDISSPAEPRLLGELELTPRPISIANWHADYVGSMFYVVDKDGLSIVDASSPALPQEVGFYANPDWEGSEPEGVGGAGNDIITGMASIDSPEEFLEGIYNSGSYLGVAVSNGYAYIAAGESGLIVLDVRDPETVEEVARLDVPDRPRQILISGDLVFLIGFRIPDDETWRETANWMYPLHIVDISDPSTPILMDSVEEIKGLPVWQLIVTLGDYVYFVSYNTVYVIDIYGGYR